MDQAALPFIMDDNKTYEITNSSDVWCVSGPSGQDKRMCTVQLTVFADRIPRIKPLIVFRGKSLCL